MAQSSKVGRGVGLERREEVESRDRRRRQLKPNITLYIYPLILSDDVDQTVYHAACAVELAAEIMVDLK